MGRNQGGRKRPFEGDFGGMGPGRGMGMMGPGGRGMGMMGGPMGGMMGPGMGGPPGPMAPGMRPGMGPMGGRGMPGRGRAAAMQAAQAIMQKRARMMENGGNNGVAGVRGASGMDSMMGGGPRPPGGAAARPGFLAKGGTAGQKQYRNGGPGPPPDQKTMSMITNAVLPKDILHLWADESRPWAEGHLGQGLLRFAQLVEEVCPDESQELKGTPQFRSMIMAAKTNMHSMRPTDRSKVSRAMGKLQYQDEDLCVALVRAMEQDLHESPPIAVAGIMAGLGQVAYRPETRALSAVENYIVNNAANLTPKDVKDVLVAFAAIEAPPQAMVVNAAILQLPAKFVETHPRDLSQLLTALNQIQFAPPPPFVLACGNYLMHRLELFVNAPPGQGQPVDVSVISHIMTALSGFKFDPPAPLLTLVCKAVLMQIKSAEAADICDLLEIFADVYWHPSDMFLGEVQGKLTDSIQDISLASICTSLWSFAIFAFIPELAMQKAYANRIEQDLEDLNAFQICSLLWVYALFRTCTQGVWNTLVGRLTQFDVADVDDSALKYFFQVFILLQHSTASMHSYQVPERLLAQARRVWQEAKEAETRGATNDFEKDVLRILSRLNINQVERKALIEDGLFTVDLWIPQHGLAIMCLPKDKFTVNAVTIKAPQGPITAPQPLGQTKMMQNLLRVCQIPVCMVPHHIWFDLASDALKCDFLKRQIQKSGSVNTEQGML